MQKKKKNAFTAKIQPSCQFVYTQFLPFCRRSQKILHKSTIYFASKEENGLKSPLKYKNAFFGRKMRCKNAKNAKMRKCVRIFFPAVVENVKQKRHFPTLFNTPAARPVSPFMKSFKDSRRRKNSREKLQVDFNVDP